MRLHEVFVQTAKRYEKKPAIIDRATNQRVTYRAALVRTLILSEKLKGNEEGFIGIMVPTLVVSAFSMNVGIPLQKHPNAFWIIMGLAIVSVGGLFLWWRKMRW